MAASVVIKVLSKAETKHDAASSQKETRIGQGAKRGKDPREVRNGRVAGQTTVRWPDTHILLQRPLLMQNEELGNNTVLSHSLRVLANADPGQSKEEGSLERKGVEERVERAIYLRT